MQEQVASHELRNDAQNCNPKVSMSITTSFSNIQPNCAFEALPSVGTWPNVPKRAFPCEGSESLLHHHHHDYDRRPAAVEGMSSDEKTIACETQPEHIVLIAPLDFEGSTGEPAQPDEDIKVCVPMPQQYFPVQSTSWADHCGTDHCSEAKSSRQDLAQDIRRSIIQDFVRIVGQEADCALQHGGLHAGAEIGVQDIQVKDVVSAVWHKECAYIHGHVMQAVMEILHRRYCIHGACEEHQLPLF